MDDLGREYYTWDYRMMVIDKPVAYRIARSCYLGNETFLDTNNATFQSWTVRVTNYTACTTPTCAAPANVSGIARATADWGVYIYELK
jgi:hypothetical protein